MTLTRSEWLGVAVVGSGAAFGLLGAVASFETVNETMQPSFGAKAWMVPVGMDLGIAVGTAGDLWMASQDKRTWWLRYIPHGLSLATVYLNVVGESTLEGRVAHALLVFLWIAFVSAVAHVVKLEAVGRRERKRLDRIRPSRWVLAPLSSARLRREMILNEQPSYTLALRDRNDRRLARAGLRDRHGSVLGWYRRLSHVERERYRQGYYEPVPQQAALQVPAAAPPSAPPPPMQLPSPNGNGHRTNGAVDPQQIAEEMHEAGELNRRDLIVKVKDAGGRLGTNRANAIIRTIKGTEGST